MAKTLAKYDAEQHYIYKKNPLYTFEELEVVKKEKNDNIPDISERKYRFKAMELKSQPNANN